MLKPLRIVLLLLWFALSTTAFSIFFLFRRKNPYNAYLVTRSVCKIGLKILGIRLHVQNSHKIYADTPCIYIGNHQDNLDVFIYGSIFPKLTFIIGKKSLRWLPFFGWVYALSGNIYIDRDNRTKALSTMSMAEDVIRNEQRSLFVFPEGTRSKGKGLGAFKKGAFYAAYNTKRPIVGIVASPYKFNLNRWQAGEVFFNVLEPYYISSLETIESDIEFLRNQFVKFQTHHS